MSYVELVKELTEAPVTWIPALLKAVVEQAIQKKVFQIPVSQVVERFEDARMQTNNPDAFFPNGVRKPDNT